MSNTLVVGGVFAAIYIITACIVSGGALRFRRYRRNGWTPSVSVIVCARNEEKYLPECLESIASLEYPAECLEIILVDDESGDGTRKLMDGFSESMSNVRVLSTSGCNPGFPGKQRPFSLAMSHAAGDIVLVTDADCRVDPSWVRAHVDAYDDMTGIVGGITAVDCESGGLFARLLAVDQVMKLAIARGCAGLGLPLTLMGNNMSFRRVVWDTVGGFDAVGPSIVEDVDLMLSIVRGTPYRLGWIHGADRHVVSRPLGGFGDLLFQRRRMLSLSCSFPDMGKLLIFLEMAMTALVGWQILFGHDVRVLITLAVAWVLGQTLVILSSGSVSVAAAIWIPCMIVFQTFYGMVLGITGLFGRHVVWKGRRYTPGKTVSASETENAGNK